ncbi:acyl-CoA dehydrogenase family protein [Aquimarina sp. 2201CG14-23]|uniref:acyl-CoA dehydrogenase family protein n=1 Tax=Aquimarina mycalae TaxID=3040073 RepID=UPI002477E930|nr:acyl-CoA dehydrogenase family protein [Aquimarina sp. 2201CG14-23]MDH7448111.1 acyl-CoA dehydrogenase family protein [Aquimarina sp. 2201CG14-23]
MRQKLKIKPIDQFSLLKKLTREEFAPRAKQYDATYSFPKENFEALFRLGLNAPTVSVEFGGLGLGNNKENIRDLWTMTTEIAKADMATARCWEGHANALMLLDNLGTYIQKEKWFAGVVNKGDIWTVWSGEPLLKIPGQTAKIGTTITTTNTGYIINGSKVFCSSASGATWANLLVNLEGSGGARHADGSPESVIMLACDLSDSSVTFDDSWWKPMGMRGSVSYKVNFNNTFIPFENQIGAPGQFLLDEWQTRWIPQYAATFLGGAEAAYEYALSHIEKQQRQHDPFIQHRVGKMALNIQSAYMWLDQVARLWDENKINEAQSLGNMVRYQVEQLACQTVEHAIHACGARSLIQPSPLERISRDLTLYTRHDNDDQLLATIGKSILGESHDRSFFKTK